MSADLGVNTEVIRDHATTVSDCASTLDESVGVANSTKGQVNGNAFGLICSFFVSPVNEQITNLTKMISDCSAAEKRLVNCLLQWAQEMDDLEQDIVGDLQKIQGAVGTYTKPIGNGGDGGCVVYRVFNNE